MTIKLTQIQPFGILVEPIESGFSVEKVELKSLKSLFDEHQLVVLRGFRTFKNKEAFAGYCESWGEVNLWPFGKVLELIEQAEPEDHIFDNSYMPMHWDGMYRPQIPQYQIFHCIRAPKAHEGGRTTFSNTLLTVRNASQKDIECWRKVTGHYQRKMAFYQSKTRSPIITRHPVNGSPVIRYNEPHQSHLGDFINPPQMHFSGIDDHELAFFHESLQNALYAPEHLYAHQWQNGDVVIADNFSLLHGRESFIKKSPRHLQRVHVSSTPAYENPSLESYQ